MPAYVRPKAIRAVRVGGWVLCAALTYAVSTPVIGAGFAVTSIQPRATGKTLRVNGNLDLALTPKVEDAIGKGIPIQLLIEAHLYRNRSLLWDERVETWTVRRELSYHALSGQYLIGGVTTVPTDRESFTAVNEALTELGAIEDMTLPLAAPLAADAEYRLDVRVRLDIEALPSLLRPVAYTSKDWNLKSEWTTWTVQH